jgi:hypothetical protein
MEDFMSDFGNQLAAAISGNDALINRPKGKGTVSINGQVATSAEALFENTPHRTLVNALEEKVITGITVDTIGRSITFKRDGEDDIVATFLHGDRKAQIMQVVAPKTMGDFHVCEVLKYSQEVTGYSTRDGEPTYPGFTGMMTRITITQTSFEESDAIDIWILSPEAIQPYQCDALVAKDLVDDTNHDPQELNPLSLRSQSSFFNYAWWDCCPDMHMPSAVEIELANDYAVLDAEKEGPLELQRQKEQEIEEEFALEQARDEAERDSGLIVMDEVQHVSDEQLATLHSGDPVDLTAKSRYEDPYGPPTDADNGMRPWSDDDIEEDPIGAMADFVDSHPVDDD